ncbi:hypothetical protein ACFH04_08345 [Streptomyces noboritoensis]|uniref:Xaa-Pro dipeptidyl-peptidase C-terminal domain-containing protein n=1 Tax=Streptomyces noboritoensis TaxID=67337 RepID=A0ABV6TD65_9ACTN
MHDDYPSFPGFENVSLQDSYVLDIAVHPGTLSLHLDLLLLPTHPAYAPPLPGEHSPPRVGAVATRLPGNTSLSAARLTIYSIADAGVTSRRAAWISSAVVSPMAPSTAS